VVLVHRICMVTEVIRIFSCQLIKVGTINLSAKSA
jgi:hypothetical protein